MDSEARSVPSKTSSGPNQGKSISVFKKLGKTPFAIVGAIAIIILAVALLIPQGAAKIPLNVSYTVGEKMVYYTTEELTVQRFNETADQVEEDVHLSNPSLNFTETVEVVDFDGETYTEIEDKLDNQIERVSILLEEWLDWHIRPRQFSSW